MTLPTVPSTDIQIVEDAVFLETVHFLSNDEDFESNILNRPTLEVARNTGWLKTFVELLDINKENKFAKNSAFNKDFGTTAGTVAQGNDPRFTDTRIPKSHRHNFDEINPVSTSPGFLFFNGTGYEFKPKESLESTTINWNSLTGVPSYFASTIDLVFGLKAALLGKADKFHNHEMGQVNGLVEALTLKAPLVHNHPFSNITSRPSTLAGYGIVDSYTKAEVDSKVTRVNNSVRIPRMLLPFYIYPSNAYTNPTYNRLIEAARNYPGVEINAILNNSNGPGAAKDGNFTAVIKRLRATDNIKVLGYITTSNAARPIADAKAEVDTWLEWYSPDGIFIDEMSNAPNPAHVAYYVELTAYIHSKGIPLSIGNPGTAQLPMYFEAAAADIICVFENTYVPDEPFLKGDYAGGYADYSTNGRAALMYAQPTFDTETAKLLMKHTAMWFITSETAPVLWGLMPPYFEKMLGWMESYGNSVTIPTTPVIQRLVGNPTVDGPFVLSVPTGEVFKVSLDGIDIEGDWTFSNKTLTIPDVLAGSKVVAYYHAIGEEVYKSIVTATGDTIAIPADINIWQITANGIDLDTYIQNAQSVTIPGASSGDLIIVYGNIKSA